MNKVQLDVLASLLALGWLLVSRTPAWARVECPETGAQYWVDVDGSLDPSFA